MGVVPRTRRQNMLNHPPLPLTGHLPSKGGEGRLVLYAADLAAIIPAFFFTHAFIASWASEAACSR